MSNTEVSYVPIVDRQKLCLDLLDQEVKYQHIKSKYIEQLMNIYEHTCDIVDMHRIIQLIVDAMAARPRIDFDYNNFTFSYEIEIKL